MVQKGLFLGKKKLYVRCRLTVVTQKISSRAMRPLKNVKVFNFERFEIIT